MTPELKKAFALINKHTVSVHEAANFLDYSHDRVLRRIENGQIEAARIGDELRIVSKSLDAYAKSRITKVT